MLIVLEGIDGSGKSTLMDALSQSITQHVEETGELTRDVDCMHRGPLQSPPLTEYVFDLEGYDPSLDNVICDRWHVGETIYGPLYRGESLLSPEQVMYVEMFLNSLGALKLVMDTPYSEVQKRLMQRGEHFLQPQHQRIVYDAYAGLGKDWLRVKPDWRIKRSPTNVDALLEKAETLGRRGQDMAQYHSYVGGFEPTTILFGERRNVMRPGRPPHMKAFVPYRDTSGFYLMTALYSADIQSEFGLANACEEDIPNLMVDLGNPRTIALGKVAERELREAGVIPDRVLAHPQYVRRFQAGTVFTYGAMMKEVIDG